MISNKYEKHQKLGEGTYGAVFRAQNTQTKEFVAFKIVRMDQEDDGIPSSSLREISILQIVNHINIIKLIEVLCEEGHITMVFEYMEKDLRWYLEQRNRIISLELMRSYFFQLLCGVYYLHQNGIIHRDIRPDNLLINQSGLLKIGDFGNARICQAPLSTNEGNESKWYHAPELLFSNYTYDFPSDIWSVGCTMAQVVRRYPLFTGDSQIDQMNKIVQILGKPDKSEWPEFDSLLSPNFSLPSDPAPNFASCFPPETDPDLLDLLKKLLEMNPKRRITAEDALKHKFFDSIAPRLREVCMCKIEINENQQQ